MSLSAQEISRGRENANIGTELVLETDAMRIWHLRLQPGETAPPHRHDRPYFWTIVTGGTALSRSDNGEEVAVTYRAGDTKHFPDLTHDNGFVHDLTNVGETELVFVTVEFVG